MHLEEAKKMYVEFMKTNGMKINNGTFLTHKLRKEIKNLLTIYIDIYKTNPKDIDNLSRIIELSKAVRNYKQALRYVNVLLEFNPKNRKYLAEKSDLQVERNLMMDSPIKENELIELIKFLNLNNKELCDGKFTIVKEWCKKKLFDFNELAKWFNVNGIFCDCEVLYNMDEVID